MLLMLGRQGPHCSWTHGKTFRSSCETGMGKKQRPNDAPDAGATEPALLMDARQDFPIQLRTGHGEETEAQ